MSGTAVENMIGIDLQTLDEVAALQTRIDRKYVIGVNEVDPLLAGLPDATCALEIAGSRIQRYRSIYFDTPFLDSYFSAGRSRRRRWKVRTRSYLDSGHSWLEVKTRGPRGHTVKQRIELDGGSTGLSEEGARFVASVIGETATRALRPTLMTTYSRNTLYLADDGARATIDTDLGFTSAATLDQMNFPQLCIVESKSGASPSALDRLLWRGGHRPVSLSKYGAGMAALNPDVPRLKWHRVLTRDLQIERKAS